MKKNIKLPGKLAILFFFVFSVTHVCLSVAQPGSPATKSNKEAERFVTIDFNDVDINVFIKFISELTGKNFVVDAKVKGKVTIISPTKISVNEAYKVFESVLEVHGFAAVPAGEITKIIPSPSARTKNIETLLEESSESPEDKIVTQLIPLTYADSNEIKRLFAPLVSKSSVILAYPPSNMLIITDVYSNITRLMRILDVVDVPGIGQEISIVSLQFADAKNMVQLLDSIFKTEKKPKKGAAQLKTLIFVPDERTNVIVVRASEVDTARIKKLVAMLDREVPKGKEKIHVYYLEHATAEDLAKVLQELPTKKGKAPKGAKEAPVISEKVRITADKATNSLIIMAEKEDYLILKDIIEKLDIPRSMVYIESLIMEVNTDSDFRLGTQWVAASELNYENSTGGFGGSFSGEEDPISGNIHKMLQGSLQGFSLGMFGEAITIGDVMYSNLAAIVQAFKYDKDVHILSTPQLLTTDNEEASITVGKNVPFQTRSAADSAVETYSSYEYKDVGITLKITPQISKDRMVRLKIFQEITKLDEVATTSEDRPTTLKRTIDTTVVVKHKNTVVIGGLIDDQFTGTEYKVPCLGDIPGLGWLFKTKSKATEKTNLFVFLTPHVVQTPEEMEEIYSQKQIDFQRAEEEKEEAGIKMYE
ncbi:type II secretion system secretin GspD [Thermodesulfobacteriota bacterium]